MIDQRKLRGALVFLTRLLALAVPFHIMIGYADLSLLQQMTARSVHALLSVFEVGVSLNGAVLRFDGFDVLVSRDSTGWKSAFFLTALIVATRARQKEKVIGVFLLVPAIYAINVMRVAVTAYSAFYGVEVFNALHDYLWQAGMVFVVLALWIMWLKEKSKMLANPLNTRKPRL